MRTIYGMVLSALVATTAQAESKDLFTSGTHGFSMEAPPSASGADQSVALFFLAPVNSFAANVNVGKQRLPGTLEAYDELSLSQFKENGLTVVQRKLSTNELHYEYRGAMQGRSLHWYVRGVRVGEFIYLVTATGLEEQWDEQKAVLMKSVDSFTVKK